MNREIKFRFVDTNTNKVYHTAKELYNDNDWLDDQDFDWFCRELYDENGFGNITKLQYTGLKDKKGKEWFVDDIGEFDNGDRFVLKMEDWLEVCASWIGNPECEDQIRDLYRIEKAKNIGNIYENSELLK